MTTRMHHLRISSSALIFLVIFNLLSSSVKGFRNGVTRMHSSPDEDGVAGNKRKVLVLDVVLDYDYAGANPKHDPKGKKPGGGNSKNP